MHQSAPGRRERTRDVYSCRGLTGPLSHHVGAECVNSLPVEGSHRSTPGFLRNVGELEPYVEHGESAQHSNGGLIACFGRQVARKTG